MRVLVTGGTGFIGSHTARALIAAGHDVRLLARSPAKVERVFPPGTPQPGDVVTGDVTDANCVEDALDGCEGLVHAAAVVALEATRRSEVEGTNLLGVRNVVGGAHARGLERIVYVSSAASLFDARGGAITADSPVTSSATAYGRSKADGELLVRELQAAGASIHVTYPCGVVGPDDPGMSEANHAISVFVNTTVLLTSSGFQMVDVRDLAAVHVRLLEPGGSGRWPVGGHFFSWHEMADLMDAAAGTPVRRIAIPGGLLRIGGWIGDAMKRVRSFDFPLTRESMIFATQWPGVDNTKTLEALGFDFRSAAETVSDTLRWMASAGHVDASVVPAAIRGESTEAAASPTSTR